MGTLIIILTPNYLSEADGESVRRSNTLAAPIGCEKLSSQLYICSCCWYQFYQKWCWGQFPRCREVTTHVELELAFKSYNVYREDSLSPRNEPSPRVLVCLGFEWISKSDYLYKQDQCSNKYI